MTGNFHNLDDLTEKTFMDSFGTNTNNYLEGVVLDYIAIAHMCLIVYYEQLGCNTYNF